MRTELKSQQKQPEQNNDMRRKLTELEESIVAFCEKTGGLAELCTLWDRDVEGNEVPAQWIPNPEVVALAKHIRASALADAGEAIQVACMNGELPDVCEEAIKVIPLN